MIERQTGKSVSRIFAEDGEPVFRAVETEVARKLSRLENHVIATGGGMVLAEANRHALEQAGAVILLQATAETIYQRIAHHTHRPLLAKADPRHEIELLLEQRREAYEHVPIKIQTDGKEKMAIVQEILRRLNMPCPLAGIHVELGDRSYPIQIGRNWIDSLGARLAPHFAARPCTLVTNPEIGRLWAKPVLESLNRAGYTVGYCEVPAGEEHKTLATVSLIYDRMIAGQQTRQSGVIALGGGVIGDMAGFAAATMLRGIALIQLPTTLLAMVDSSVGGKTGVNHPLGKNLIGAFWQPTYVGIELDFLETLPERELKSGMAEVIKYGVIADEALFEYLEQNMERALAREPRVLTRLITRCCQIKAEVVGQDERESGMRAILNFGHTFGHAAEALAQYRTINHGEGVAMGMIAAARLACRRGLIRENDVDRLQALVRRAGLPEKMLPFTAEEYWRAMSSDKKVRDGKIGFVLPERLGGVEVYRDITQQEVGLCLKQ
jgi:3-dehydroquinate synthase